MGYRGACGRQAFDFAVVEENSVTTNHLRAHQSHLFEVMNGPGTPDLLNLGDFGGVLRQVVRHANFVLVGRRTNPGEEFGGARVRRVGSHKATDATVSCTVPRLDQFYVGLQSLVAELGVVFIGSVPDLAHVGIVHKITEPCPVANIGHRLGHLLHVLRVLHNCR